jgi:hypothetical protein
LGCKGLALKQEPPTCLAQLDSDVWSPEIAQQRCVGDPVVVRERPQRLAGHATVEQLRIGTEMT